MRKEKNVLQEFCWAAPVPVLHSNSLKSGRQDPCCLSAIPKKKQPAFCLVTSLWKISFAYAWAYTECPESGSLSGQRFLWRCCLQWARSNPGQTELSQIFFFCHCCSQILQSIEASGRGTKCRQHSVLGSKCRQKKGRRGKKQPNVNRGN